jgi:DnaK suppressor protein
MSKRRTTGTAGRTGRRPETSLRDLRRDLLGRRQELLSSVRQKWRDLQPLSAGATIEPAGEAGNRQCLTPETEVAYELMGSQAHLLKEIDCALEKIDRGSYGHCEDCGEPIAASRLKALPFAVRCTACQESLERHAAASGGRPARWG